MGNEIPPGPAVSPRVELRLVGTFSVIRGGTELAGGELGSRKSRTLLKLLAVQRPGPVPVDRIIDVLWADDPPAAAEQNVASLEKSPVAPVVPLLIATGLQCRCNADEEGGRRQQQPARR